MVISGMYLSIQCDETSRQCWCVDTISGVQIYGTRVRGNRPNCSRWFQDLNKLLEKQSSLYAYF